MRAGIIIIANVCIDDPLELILVDRDDVVGAFAPDGPNDALAVAVLPRGASGADDLIKFEGVNTVLATCFVRPVIIEESVRPTLAALRHLPLGGPTVRHT